MKTLEEYLIEEGILELFLGNCSKRDICISLTVDTTFAWSGTKEGGSFWAKHSVKAYTRSNSIISSYRVIELIEKRIPRFRKGVK